MAVGVGRPVTQFRGYTVVTNMAASGTTMTKLCLSLVPEQTAPVPDVSSSLAGRRADRSRNIKPPMIQKRVALRAKCVWELAG